MLQFITNLWTRDVVRSAELYARLGGFVATGRGDTFMLLAAPDGTRLALIDWVSELVPRAARGIAEGTYLSIVTEDVDAALAVAAEFELEVIERTETDGADTLHAVIRDLDGRVVELTTPAAHLALPPRQTIA
jgi:hypothetical protein